MLCMIIGDELKAKGLNVNMEVLLKKAILHDSDESVTSDVPYNVKNCNPEFKARIDQVLQDLSWEGYRNASPLFQDYHRLTTSCKEGIEGNIVGLCDMIELAVYCFEEVSTGNMFMKGLYEKSIALVKEKPIFLKSEFAMRLIAFIEVVSNEEIAELNSL